ncbi:MAG TPA: hypothetical protein VMV44_12610 [Rectinemataceae bacterium]|nr:hypothetical protein [Rectinemataceae bacterium]
MQGIRAASSLSLIAASFFVACASPLPFPPLIEAVPTIGDAP